MTQITDLQLSKLRIVNYQNNQENDSMAFVNEYISESDIKKYDIEALNKRPGKGIGRSYDWTIDRDADIWLHKFYTESDHTEPDGGYTGVKAWDFYWKGTLMLIEMKDLDGGGGYGKPRWSKKQLLSINIPTELQAKRQQIIEDFERAYSERGGEAGILAKPDFPFFTFILEKRENSGLSPIVYEM